MLIATKHWSPVYLKEEKICWSMNMFFWKLLHSCFETGCFLTRAPKRPVCLYNMNTKRIIEVVLIVRIIHKYTESFDYSGFNLPSLSEWKMKERKVILKCFIEFKRWRFTWSLLWWIMLWLKYHRAHEMV